MKIPRLRFNPQEQATGDRENWSEIADALLSLVNMNIDLTPKNINKAIDELDGLISLEGEKGIKLENEDGDMIVRDRGTRSQSLGAVIRKLGRITNHSGLKNYYLSGYSAPSYSPKPTQGSLFGSSNSWDSGWSSSSSWSKPHKPYVPKPKTHSYGGVVIRDDGMVLVVEPANHYSDVIWTFPKGGIDEGETPEIAGLREVKEESGWDAEIIEKIDGSYEGVTTITEYFLMKPIGVQGEWQYQGTSKEETWQAIFVPYECARLLVATSHKKSAERDVSVLDKAYAMWLELNQ